MKVIYEGYSFEKKYEMVVNTSSYSPNETEKFICRFCGENDPKYFKSTAHVIPEFTGNKELKHFSECDSCNNKFSKYERNLSIFGGIKNIISGIKGKKYPKYIDKENGFSVKSDKDGVIFRRHKINDSIKFKNGYLSISSETKKFKPRLVFKALVKIALSMIDKDEMYKFKKTIEWLSEPEDTITPNKHPIFILIESETNKPSKKPKAILFKKIKKHNSPEYAFTFHYSYFAYQIWIPFNKNDYDLDYNNFSFPLSPLVTLDLINLKPIKFNHYYMTTLENCSLNDEIKQKVTKENKNE